jgi:hypothetical protein
MVTKAAIAASRIKFIKAALANLERELENAEGSEKEVFRKWIVGVYQTLRRLGRHTLH